MAVGGLPVCMAARIAVAKSSGAREMGAESDFTSAIKPIEKAAGVVVNGKPA